MLASAANGRRAFAAAAALIVVASNSTATSAVFVAYRRLWKLTPADTAIAFAVYVGTLVPVLLLFGGLPERVGRRPVIFTGVLLMIVGTGVLLFANGLPTLIVARLFQGAGAALSISPISASFTELYRGNIGSGQELAIVTAVGLAAGPVITAIAYNLGGGIHYSYFPVWLCAIATLALVQIFAGARGTGSSPSEDEPLPASVVWGGLRFAMPLVFVSWASTSLYLSLVPSYLAASLHVVDPLIGASAFLVTQLATIAANIRFGMVPPERAATPSAACAVAGLALLILGTTFANWIIIVLATILVGAGAGVANGASFGIAGRIGRGQRARIFAHLLVAAYLGYSLPSLAIGFVASRTSFTAGFLLIVALFALISAVLPILRLPQAKLQRPAER